MSSATSIEASAPAAPADSTFKPWQFFLLAGMLAATATVLVATGQSAAAIVLLSFTVVAASFVGLGVYRSLAPLVAPESAPRPALLGGRTRAALEREKLLVLRTIKELEFDYAMKKVSKADFEEMAGRLRARALRLMRQLDAAHGYRSEIERELQARLGPSASMTQAVAAPQQIATPPQPLAPANAASASVVTCPGCETANDTDARFCKQCGSKLA